jgi:hypothetical protein
MKYSDTTLIVGDRKFECHKFMLAKKSDVFDAMFSHNFAEKNTGRTCIILRTVYMLTGDGILLFVF